MSKQFKKSDPSDRQVPPRATGKILPLKQHFITFQSDYDYGNHFAVKPCLVKNPKWCHLQLKLGHTGSYKKYQQLHRSRSLRLRSLHLESFSLDSQGCGDRINGYFGELDTLTRAGHTLKNLSLSVTLDDDLVKRYNKQDVYHRLEKFVKKQKYLDEFAFYNGTRKDPKRIAKWLGYLEKTLKVLTVENLTLDDLFKRYTFPKLEVLRFEYILFYGSEKSFDLSVVMRCFEQIFSLRSLQALKFVQYHRYYTEMYYEMESEENEDDEAENNEEAGNINEEGKEAEEMDIENDNEDQGQDEENENENMDENEEVDEEGENENADDDEEDKNQVEENKDENDAENDSGDQAGESPDVEAVGPNVWKVSGEDGLAKLFEALAKSFKAEAEARKKTRNLRQKKYDITMHKIKEFPIKFWEVLRESLDANKKKQLKVKYHKQDEANEEKMKKEFGRIFKGLSEGQCFEYEVREITSFNNGYGFQSEIKSLSSSIFV